MSQFLPTFQIWGTPVPTRVLNFGQIWYTIGRPTLHLHHYLLSLVRAKNSQNIAISTSFQI